jgi:hypothetical protein
LPPSMVLFLSLTKLGWMGSFSFRLHHIMPLSCEFYAPSPTPSIKL